MGEEKETLAPNAKKRSLAPTNGRIQLLLHCVDGCVPYLNPSQLEQHFPPSTTDLWLGIAVRDACVAPIFDLGKQTKKSKAKSSASADTPSNKVRGYSFGPNPPDPWLLPYTRLTVPAFDVRSTKDNSHNTSKNTNNAIHVWTPHGRQKLTPELYATSSLEGLQSHHTVSLFDDVDESEYSGKRKERAILRNQKWFQDLATRNQSMAAQQNALEENDQEHNSAVSSSLLWKPVLLPHDGEMEESSHATEEKRKPIAKEIKDQSTASTSAVVEHVPSGIAFVGRWTQGTQLNTLIGKNPFNSGTDFGSIPWKGVLATYTLDDLIDIACTGTINVIGSSLPQKWAKEKLALGLDLTAISESSMGETAIKTAQSASDPVDVSEPDAKRQKTSKENDACSPSVLNSDGCIDLSDKVHTRDPGPLVQGCNCFVCKDNRFSRAYIHHLVVAKEMVAEILLFGHNLHALLQLLRAFDTDSNKHRSAFEVKELIYRQLPQMETK